MIKKIMKTINEVKEENKIKTSEELFGIVPQPINQCPIIDKTLAEYKKKLEAVILDLKWLKASDPDFDKEVKKILSNMDDLWNINEAFEEIRRSAEDIRVWGDDWKSLCKVILEENDLINNYKK